MSPIRDARALAPALIRRPATRGLAMLLSLGLFLPVSWAASAALAPAQAATSSTSATSTSATSTTVTTVKKRKVTAVRTLRLARAQKGKPYRRGADGPTAFDCSGLVKYVMAKQHLKLPHSAQGQYKRSRKIAKSKIRVGDLVFFRSGGHVYHVGIYAGHHKIWHAPKPGSRVKLATIWTSKWRAGRIVA